MKAENKAYLDANRHYYTILIQAGIIKHLDGHTRENLLRIIREEFAPNYLINLWCQSCIADLLKFAYMQYDKWLAENPEPVAEIATEVVPASIAGLTIKTTFPKHDQPKKKRRRK